MLIPLQIIFKLLKWCWRILYYIRELIYNTFIIIAIIAIIGSYWQICFSTPKLTKNALIMDLNGIIVDKPVIHNKIHKLGRTLLGLPNKRPYENSLFDIVNALRYAKNDNSIIGLILSLKDFTGANQVSLQYIGKALNEFRKTGKPIYAIGDSYNQDQYFLASYANKIYLTPYGSVNLNGFKNYNFYYKTLLNKLKINSHIFRSGIYKSAVEPYLRDNMSDEAREVDNRWISKLWKNYLNTVANNRKITTQQLFPGAKELLLRLRNENGDSAQSALKHRLVDAVASKIEIENDINTILNKNKNKKHAFKTISIYDYQLNKLKQEGQIAVIFANGAIINGLERPGLVGSDTTAAQIRNARLNKNIKAIIFRINSPGGSISASETIRSELFAARKAGKPVVASMGGVAASGGYWISTPANYIIANENTLTGSIGVFSIINTIEKTLDSIGIHSDGVNTSPLVNPTIGKEITSEYSQMMQINVDNGYHNFLSLVAQSRNKTYQEINKISQGIVWIGNDAIKKGLIDQLGDFDDAVKKAAELADLKNYQLHWYVNDINLLVSLPQLINNSQIKYLIKYLIFNFIESLLGISDNTKLNNTNSNFIWNDPRNSYIFCLTCSQIQ